MVRHWPPKLFVLMTLAFLLPDTTSNLQQLSKHSTKVFTLNIRIGLDLVLGSVWREVCHLP